MLTRIEREMSATEREFARGLHAAFGPPSTGDNRTSAVHSGRPTHAVRWEGASVDIYLSELSDLVIAGLRLPRLLARFSFTDGSELERVALLARLDRYQQRGGG